MKNFFKKLEHGFLAETPKIEKTSFPFKTALSEANVKTNVMATAKWTYHKEWSFASNYFIFLENLLQYSYFPYALDFDFRVLFPCILTGKLLPLILFTDNIFLITFLSLSFR